MELLEESEDAFVVVDLEESEDLAESEEAEDFDDESLLSPELLAESELEELSDEALDPLLEEPRLSFL